MKRAFLIHGWGGSPQEGWRPWLKNELEQKGFEVSVPVMPDSEHPRMDAWLGQLRDAVGAPDENCYFIGHSLGCITILRYLERLPENQLVGGVVLVAGFSDLDIAVAEDEDTQELKSFFETELDFEKVKQHCRKFVAIHSDNDPYVALQYADIFRDRLGAKVIMEQGRGHFSGDDGIIELPSALESIHKLAGE